MTRNPALPDHLRPLPTPSLPWGGRAPLALPPTPLTPLVGREREAALAVSLLRRVDVRLLTLTGPGGIGKTRLAIQVAGELAAELPDGVWFIPLASVLDPGRATDAIARALGITEVAGRPVRDALITALREANSLLVLDNFEHLLAVAPLVTDLLRTCPRLTVLATSRALLRVAGEQALPVPPLALPDPDATPSLERLAQSAAVRLFASRAQAVAPSFDLTDDSAPLVAEICRRLDGLPLAIELAAAQSGILPPAALLARIRARLPLPIAGPRDAPDRQRTMHDAVAWSYGLLSVEERALFRRVGVFVGGFGLDAAEAVGAEGRKDGETERESVPSVLPPRRPAVLDHLASLVERSLVRQEAWEGESRFSMLETIRGFALEQLTARGEAEAVAGAHAAWCLELAERSSLATVLPGGDRQLRRLEVEHANLRAALAWLDQQGDGERLLRLAAALGRFWFAHGHFAEGRRWLERALADPRSAAHHARARALVDLGQFHYIQGERARGEELLGESLAVLAEHADAVTLTDALVWKGWLETERGNYDRAEAVLAQALGLAATIPDPTVAASATRRVVSNLGVVAHERGDLETARARHVSVLAGCRAHGDVLGVIRSLRNLGDIARDRDDYAGAVAAYRESLALLGERGDPRVVVNALAGSALAAAAWGQAERAARLLGAAAAARERFGVGVDLPAERATQERAVALVRAAIGESALQAAWSAGRDLPLAAAIAEVQTLSPPAVAAEAIPDRAGVTISPRESEVLGLLVAGNTDREIAEALFLSVRTVEGHVARILAKLGAPTRTAAARAAFAAGLVPSDAPHAPR